MSLRNLRKACILRTNRGLGTMHSSHARHGSWNHGLTTRADWHGIITMERPECGINHRRAHRALPINVESVATYVRKVRESWAGLFARGWQASSLQMPLAIVEVGEENLSKCGLGHMSGKSSPIWHFLWINIVLEIAMCGAQVTRGQLHHCMLVALGIRLFRWPRSWVTGAHILPRFTRAVDEDYRSQYRGMYACILYLQDSIAWR